MNTANLFRKLHVKGKTNQVPGAMLSNPKPMTSKNFVSKDCDETLTKCLFGHRNMENTTAELPHETHCSDTSSLKSNKSLYVSFIKINGKPILPPLITEEERLILQKYKQQAMEKELKLSQLKQKNATELNQISSEISSISSVPSNRQSTPARPSTLHLVDRKPGKTFLLSKKNKVVVTTGDHALLDKKLSSNDMKPSPKIVRSLDKGFRSSVEQRLATGGDLMVENKETPNYKKSPIAEHLPDKFAESDNDSFTERKTWSPLKVESLNLLKVELPTQDTHEESDGNLEVSMDESQNTPDTVTQSPSLMRQNSYTLLNPSPALLNFLETQREQDNTHRSQSGRKTWDLTKAKKNWDPPIDGEPLRGSPVEHCTEDESDDAGCLKKKGSSSLDSLTGSSGCQKIHEDGYSMRIDSVTSPESDDSKRCHQAKLSRAKAKGKGKKSRLSKSVPSPTSKDKVPLRDNSGSTPVFVPYGGDANSEMSELSSLMLQMKFNHEQQRKELEERHKTEMKTLEMLFQRKEAELLDKVGQTPKKTAKSIYSQRSEDVCSRERRQLDARMMGDGNYNGFKSNYSSQVQCRRPHSAKDGDLQEVYSFEADCNRRTRSMDFAHANQDTDLDVSFQDDYTHSRDTTFNNEYIIESDSYSNFSSRSSTMSSDNRHVLPSSCNLKKFQGMSSEEYAKYNQAAAVITAAARGFLTRRLLRTAHVQGLITTLKDAMTCADQLQAASDIGDSDIVLMKRLRRQIKAAWYAVYGVFFSTETSIKMQLIATDRERLRAATSKTPSGNGVKKKRISSATRKSLDRKKGNSVMSKSQTSNGFSRVRVCSKMAASYPSPYYGQKLK